MSLNSVKVDPINVFGANMDVDINFNTQGNRVGVAVG